MQNPASVSGRSEDRGARRLKGDATPANGIRGDPQAFKVGDTWYAIGTGTAPDGKQFPILRSKNFTDREFVAGALEPLKDPEFKDYWAPEIAERDGKFYLYYAADMRMRVAVFRQADRTVQGHREIHVS